MKLVIPSECQIGARKIRIRRSEQGLEIGDMSAQTSMFNQIIRISTVYHANPRHNEQLLETLLHEAVHIIDHLYIRALDEEQIGALGSGLAQFLISLGIEPDFSQIPEEEK